MNINDRAEFKSFVDGLSAVYGKEKLPMMAVQIYFEALSKYSLSSVMAAASAHLSDVERGTFFPRVADFVRNIEGDAITADQILAAARLADTPLGVLARIQIGSYDLNNKTDMFYLKQRAEECLQLLPEWKKGNYTEHQISEMLNKGVNPAEPLFIGAQKPANHRDLAALADKVKVSDRHLMLVKPEEEEIPEGTAEDKRRVSEFIQNILEG